MTALAGTPLDPRQRTPHRPYARKRGGPPSVTTIIGAQAKDGLQWGAAKENALFAVHHYDEWCDLDQPEAVDRIRKHFKGVWDGRAALGTLVALIGIEVLAGDFLIVKYGHHRGRLVVD